jgi:hypothetical protein
MTPGSHSVHDDLAYLRSLVDEDWRPGLWAFGALYVSLGATLVAHVLISWGAGAGYLPLRGASLLTTYIALYVVASLVWTGIGARTARELQLRGAHRVSVKSRAGMAARSSAIWS